MTSIPEMLSQLFAEYTSAEEKIKSCERYTLASPTVAINQMRYAGCHILEYLKCDDKDENLAKRSESIEKATNHCKRASFDALETLIFAQLEFIADFQSLCRAKRDVQSVYPDYVSDYSSLVVLQERLQTFKMVQTLTNDEVKELEGISSRVTALKRKILKKKILVDRLDSIEVADGTVLSVQQFLLSFTATVLGTVLGIFGVLFGVWGVLSCALWVKFVCMAVILGCFLFACKCFYIWSANRLLTEEQRRLLSERFNIKWR